MTNPSTPIQHVIVCCQENHSFDSYFGSYSGLPAGFGIPPGFTQPDGSGGTVAPFHFTNLTSDGYRSLPRLGVHSLRVGQRADGRVLHH